MGFFQLLKSLDELLYEVMSWLLFYPITLWRTLRHPWRMMDYADTELADKPAEQYSDRLSPPLFLSAQMVRLSGKKLERETLRPPFYSQCYAAAPGAAAECGGDGQPDDLRLGAARDAGGGVGVVWLRGSLRTVGAPIFL